MKSKKIKSATKLLLMLVGLGAPFCVIAGEPFMLVTETEYLQQLGQQKTRGKNMKFKTRSIPGKNQKTPVITINSPSVTSGLFSPIRIEINFKAPDDAIIQADSLKVRYGWLNLDITERIKEHAKISDSGIVAENVMLPTGKHNITIEISDTKERSAEKEVSFEILKP